MNRALTAVLAAAALAAVTVTAAGCGEAAPDEPKPRKTAQEKWDEQRGSAWQTYTERFAEGVSVACSSFFNTENGKLYASGEQNEWTVEDCEGLDSDDPNLAAYVEVPSTPPARAIDAGLDAGVENACLALFDNAGVDEFAWGTDRYTVDDCIAASGVLP